MTCALLIGDCACSSWSLARLETIWDRARERTGSGARLCGACSAADMFFAPVATRIATCNLPVFAPAADCVAAHLAHPSFRRWRAMGMVDGPDRPFCRRDYPRCPWPGPAPIPARAVETGPAVNDACPCSAVPVTHFLLAGGRVFGSCNAFCRDRTAADPEAWPAFMAVYHS